MRHTYSRYTRKLPVPKKKKKEDDEEKPPWDDTQHDLTSMKLDEALLRSKHSARKPTQRALAGAFTMLQHVHLSFNDVLAESCKSLLQRCYLWVL